MCGPEDASFENEPLDPDEVLWTPGVDYVGGWQAAREAGDELLAALTSVGLATKGIRVQAHAAANGSGVVRLRLPVATARAIADAICTMGESKGRAVS